MRAADVDIQSLTVEDRFALIERLWESLHADEDRVQLSAEQEAELDRRIARIDGGESTSRPWEEIRDELMRKHQ